MYKSDDRSWGCFSFFLHRFLAHHRNSGSLWMALDRTLQLWTLSHPPPPQEKRWPQEQDQDGLAGGQFRTDVTTFPQ